MNTEPLRILLADDDETDRLIFADALQELSIKTVVCTVNNGIQLMESLTQEGAQLPHLLFLDLNMPRQNGLECLKEIRSNELLKDISIAIYSTSASKDDLEKTFLAGANIFIEKPGDFCTLKKVLDKAITAASYYLAPPFNRSNFLLRV